jgi:signal transduction histidine kinase
MKTFFATAERATKEQLADEIDIVSSSPVMEGLLHSVGGLLAIMDERRQIVAVNDTFLKMLGINDAKTTLGLRIGETLECVHAKDKPSGCGTTKYCSTCGAAIAIVSSLAQDGPVEKRCALLVNKNGKPHDMALLVRSHPVKIENQRYLLLFIQDISQEEQRAALERTFFHDINNMLGMVLGASELLQDESPSALSKVIYNASLRLRKEFDIQRCLSRGTPSDFKLSIEDSTTGRVLDETKLFFTHHPAAQERILEVFTEVPDAPVRTDMSLLLRVLYNMIINALEATAKNGIVKVWAEQEERSVSFHVWNAQEIPQDVTMRLFQRNFSTKNESGRGVGTYSMKLFGENHLGGQVKFTTSKEAGTVFSFVLPSSEILHEESSR